MHSNALAAMCVAAGFADHRMGFGGVSPAVGADGGPVAPAGRVCLLPGCGQVASHNGGYCCAAHCREHRSMLRASRAAGPAR